MLLLLKMAVGPLISTMDLFLSVNTAYLACIMVVLLFVIYKVCVSPQKWFLPFHLLSLSVRLISTSLGLQGLVFGLSPASKFGLRTLWDNSVTS